MRTRSSPSPALAIAPILLGLLLGGCGDDLDEINRVIVEPGEPVRTRLELGFCRSELPIFFAVQDEGGPWRNVPVPLSGRVSFVVTERFGMAFTFNGLGLITHVVRATVADARDLEFACPGELGTRSLSGTVAGADGGAVSVAMNGDWTFLRPPPDGFTLADVTNGAQDLVAQLDSPVEGMELPSRLIIRRGLDIPDGGTIPVLDFGAGAPVATNVLTVAGLRGDERAVYDIFYRTARGTHHTVFLSDPIAETAVPLFGVPATLVRLGDLHRVELLSFSERAERQVWQFYREPANRTLTLGDALAQPVVSTLGTAPYLRLRLMLPVQPDYASSAAARFVQRGASGLVAMIVMETDRFRGTSVTRWVLDIPDLTAAGFPAAAALRAGTPTSSSAQAWNAPLADVGFGRARDGTTMRSARRHLEPFVVDRELDRLLRPPAYRPGRVRE